MSLLDGASLTLLNRVRGKHLSSQLGSTLSKRLAHFLVGTLLSNINPIEAAVVVPFSFHESNIVAVKLLDEFHSNLWLDTAFRADVLHLVFLDDLLVRNVACEWRNEKGEEGLLHSVIQRKTLPTKHVPGCTDVFIPRPHKTSVGRSPSILVSSL